MTRELLLARRLLEAVVDPDASTTAADDAGVEFAELLSRLGVPAGELLPVETFEGMRAQDLSPAAWLYLLENGRKDQPEVPPAVLEALFLEYSDVAVRFRLVRGALGQPRTRWAYEVALADISGPRALEQLPDSWPRQRLEALERSAAAEGGLEAARQGLTEFVLYLLQDSSPAALGLAAAALAPPGDWRVPAKDVARNVVARGRSVAANYGRAFGPNI